jgi:uncharacterized protein with HEPN domain
LPSENPISRLEDILANIELIEGYTKNHSYEAFVRNRMCQDAVERCISRISEAASKLKGPIESTIPDQPWAQIRAVGNILRHEYDRVDPIFIWRIVDEDLQPLKAAIQSALERLRREDDL